MATTENNGKTWSELHPIGNFGGIVAMGTMIQDIKNPGHYRALFHDDGRFISDKPNKQNPTVFTLYSSLSTDGGMSWQKPISIFSSSSVHLCEPGAVRSPDGNKLLSFYEKIRGEKIHISLFLMMKGEPGQNRENYP